MYNRRHLLGLAGASLLGTPAFAQGNEPFPSRAVSLVVPFTAGGPTDAVARALADALRPRLGQPVIVENKSGAGGAIAYEFVARSAPDGHTLLLAGASMTMTPALAKVNYDPVSSFAPVAQVLELEIFLVVRPDLPVRTMHELITYAKAHPGKLNYASVGNGSISHFQMELFKSMAGLHMVHLPYRGASAAITDFLGGQIDLMFDSLANSGQYINNGKAKALAVAGPTRSRVLPEVPTVAEAGLPGYEATAWTGILAAARTPAAIVERLNREVLAATTDPTFQQRVTAIGARVAGAPTKDYAERIRTETTKWAALAKERGMREA